MQPSRAPLAAVSDAAASLVRRHRRWLAALAAFLAVYATLGVLRPSSDAVTVVAAARDLPGGTALAAADLLRLRLPPDAVPAGARVDEAGLLGRVVNAPLSARSVLTDAAVSSGQELARPGYAVLAVPVAEESLLAVLQAGSRVDLLAPGEASAVATGVRVVSTPAATGGGLTGGTRRVLLVELPADQAPKVAAALDGAGLTIALR